MGQEASSLGGSDVDQLRMLMNLAQLEQGLRQHPAGETSQADHAWDSDDCSPNFTLTQDGRVANKDDSNASLAFTDMVRGKQGYTRGTHIWEITWKKEHRGSHAVIGVASYSAPLRCLGHSALLGSNDESLGWNIVANVSLFNDCVINKYPANVQPKFQAPDVIRVILNMDEGTLRFKSGIDGTDYGHCLSGLRAFSRNGQKLYPAISATRQGAQIGIKYLGSAEPICDAVGGSVTTGASTSGPVVFHSEVGANIQLSNGRRTATRVRGHNNGVVMSNRPLKDNEYFEVKLDKIVALPTTYTMDIGVTTNAPEKLNFPQTMTDCEHGKTWMFCGSRVVLNKAEIERFTKITLDDLKEGSTVGLMRTAEGQLHIYLDGRLKAKCKLNIPSNVYAVVDLFGKGCQATITGGTASAQSNLSNTSSGSSTPSSPTNTSPGPSGDNASKRPSPTTAKSTVEIITEKVQTTIALMKEKDPRKVSRVFTALQKDILEVYDRLRTHNHKQMLGDRFNDMGGAQVITDYMMFLKDAGVEHDEVLRCFLECFNVLLNLTNTSLNFATSLGGTDMLAMLVSEADKHMSRYKSNKGNAQRVVYALAVLHNCSKAAANVSALRKAGAKDVLVKYCDPVEHDSSIAFIALLTLVNIMVGFEVESLKVHDNMLATIVKFARASVANTENHSAPITFQSAGLSFSLYSTEQVAAICKLSKNAACRVSLVKKNVTEHLVRLMEIGDQTEQEVACNAVWELLSEQTVEEVIMSARLTDVVKKLKDTGVKEVADAANRLLVKIRQVLRRSRVVGYTQQVLPNTPAVPHDCKYKQAFLLLISSRVLERNKRHFKVWHRAFHGTKADKVAKILDIGDLVMPGDKIRGGDNIKVREGHFDVGRMPEGFNIRQIFVSPSIRYAGHHAYATPTKYVDEPTDTTYNSQVAFQVLIAPKSYDVGKETVGATHDIDPKFSNQELEWSTDERGSTILYGLLVKLEKVGE
ncbi:SPRY domain-containing SOCS box protein 2 [Lamellibrachia satsuma]|nr:SPRY domain-containing SOCS box protein 2 [Lamellibrachia satsuma]